MKKLKLAKDVKKDPNEVPKELHKKTNWVIAIQTNTT